MYSAENKHLFGIKHLYIFCEININLAYEKITPKEKLRKLELTYDYINTFDSHPNQI